MTIYSNNARKDTIMINPGQLTFVPTGCWHDIENIGEAELKIVIVYDNERFEDLGISGSVGSLPARTLNSIFGIKSPRLFDQLGDIPSQDVVFGNKAIDISKSNSNNEIEASNSHTLNLSGTTPQVQTPGGTAVLGSVSYFPILKRLISISPESEAKRNSRTPHPSKCWGVELRHRRKSPIYRI